MLPKTSPSVRVVEPADKPLLLVRYWGWIGLLLVFALGVWAYAAPPAPGAPTFNTSTATSVVVTAPALPTGASSMTLWRKETALADSTYASIKTGMAGAATYTDAALRPGTSFTYYLQALSSSGNTNGVKAAFVTSPAPSAPAAPTFSNVQATALTVTAPALPANAQSLDLWQKETFLSDSTYAKVASTSPANRSGLKVGTSYSFYYEAVSGTAKTKGTVASVTTLDAPSAPGVPTFSVIHADRVTVTAPALPANAATMKLERKFVGQADSFYGNSTAVTPGTALIVTGLTAGTAYTFHYTATGNGVTTSGAGADVSTPPRPANDGFSAAQDITGASGTVAGTNVEASKETGEPSHWNAPQVSVWYRWTAPSTGQFVFDTIGSNFDTVLAIYTGSAVNALTKVTSNDNGPNPPQSEVLLSATSGTVYQIAVDGLGGATGSLNLNWTGYIPSPDTPLNFRASAGNAQVSLSWSAAARATKYSVFRTSDGSFPAYNAPATGTVNAPTLTFNDTTAVNGATYTYFVQAINRAGNSGFSASASALARPGSAFGPPLIRGVTGFISTGNISPQLSWYASPGAVSYRIYRRTDTSNYGAFVGTLSDGTTQWTDTPQVAGPTYFYVVTAVNSAALESARSNEVKIGTGLPTYLQNVVAKPGNNQVTISWDPVDNATSYSVARRRWVGNAFYAESTFNTSNLSYVDTSAVNGSVYSYVVSAVNAAGQGSGSESARVTPQPLATAASALVATGYADHVDLTWTAGANVATYNVYRANRAGGPYTPINAGAAYSTTPSYTDTKTAGGTTYYYVVKSFNPTGESAPSNEAKAIISPLAVTFSRVASNSVTVHLPQLPSSATGFTLYRATEGPWSAAPPASGLQSWFRADAITGVESGGQVATWPDLSGSGYTAKSSLPERNPLWISDTLGGRPVVRFDNKDDALNLPPGFKDYSAGLSLFAVYKLQATDGFSSLVDLASARPGFGGEISWQINPRNNGTTWSHYLLDEGNNSAISTSSAIKLNQFQTLGIIHQGGTPGVMGGAGGASTGVELYVDGSLKVSGNLAVPTNVVRDNSVIGNLARTYDQGLGGDVAEILLYNRALSPTERTGLDAYLARRYGLNRAMPALTWTALSGGLKAGASYTDGGVAANTTYWYRVVANGTPDATGVASSVTTLSAPPSAPATPVFSNVQTTSLTLGASPTTWPAGAAFVKVQQKLANTPESQFKDVDCAPQSGPNIAPFAIKNLAPATKYSFRFVALNEGSFTLGVSADVITAGLSSGAGGGLLGTYYDNDNFTDRVASRLDPSVDFNWDVASPGMGMGNDNFSVRWEGQIQPAYTENYVFHGSADDLMKVWINGALVVNTEAGLFDSAAISLVAAQKYDIRVDYKETTGGAQVHLQWESPSQPRQVVPADRLYVPQGSGTGLRAQYYSGLSFDAQVASRTDAQVAFGWPAAGPVPQIGSSPFSVWWTGQVQPRFSQTYTFRILAPYNYGLDPKLYINGNPIGTSSPLGTTVGTVSMVAGQKYAIQLQYQANPGYTKPQIQLVWESSSQPQEAVPSYCLFPASSDSVPAYTPPVDRALPLGAAAPSAVLAGAPITASVTIRNNGTTTWAPGDHRLNQYKSHLTTISQAEYVDDGYGNTIIRYRPIGVDWVFSHDTYIALPQTVLPGQSVTWSIPVTMQSGDRDLSWGIEDYSDSQNPKPIYKGIGAKVEVVASLTQKLQVIETTPTTARLKLPALPPYGNSYTLERSAVGAAPASAAGVPVSGRTLWLKADSLFLPEGAPVLDWKNTGGKGHAYPDNNSRAPIWSATGPGGRPIVRFDGRMGDARKNDLGDRFLTDITSPGGTEMTVFAVAKAPTVPDYQSILRAPDGGGFAMWYPRYTRSAALMQLSNDGGDDGGVDTGFVPQQWNIGSARWIAGTTNGWQAWHNGALAGQRNSLASTLVPQTLMVGSNYESEFFKGDLAEVLLYNRALSDAERVAVEGYLSGKYGIAVTQPTGATWSPVATGLMGDAIYEDTGLTPNTQYWYRLVMQTGGAPLNGEAVLAVTRPVSGPAPGAPGAPAGGVPSQGSIAVTAPGPTLPTAADYLQLQIKLPTQPDSEYADIQSGIQPDEVRAAKGLNSETTYRFRYVAVGSGGRTPSASFADYTTTSPAPEAPGVPELRGIDRNSVGVYMPPLPARATSMRLEYKESYGTASFVQVPQGTVVSGTPSASPGSDKLVGNDALTIAGLKSNTNYMFRAVAVGPGGTTAGNSGAISTADQIPGAPGEPSFANITATGVDVIAPPDLPASASSLSLQGRLLADDAPWVDVASGIAAKAVTTLDGLARAQTYSFRYIAKGAGGSMVGPSADVTLQDPLVIWRAGSGIECSGIRWPLPLATIAAGSRAKVQSFVAVDWDAKDTFAGNGARTDRYTDATSYTWTCDATTFQNGGGFWNGMTRVATIRAQNPQFIAPSAGSCTLSLLVDDGGGLNVGNGEGGGRNDAPQGFNDDPLKFSVTFTVTP